MRNIFVIIIMVTTFFACKKNDDESLLADCKLVKFNSGYDYTVIYENNRIIEMDYAFGSGQRPYNFRHMITYTANGNIDVIHEGIFYAPKWRYYYTGNTLDSIVVDSINLAPTFIYKPTVYAFDFDNGHLKKKSHSFNGLLLNYETYENDSSGNPTKTSGYILDTTTQSFILSYEILQGYDDKPNPFHTFPQGFYFYSFGPNNPINRQTINYKHNPPSISNVAFSYEFNTADVPIKVIITNQDSGDSSTKEYVYSCLEL